MAEELMSNSRPRNIHILRGRLLVLVEGREQLLAVALARRHFLAPPTVGVPVEVALAVAARRGDRVRPRTVAARADFSAFAASFAASCMPRSRRATSRSRSDSV